LVTPVLAYYSGRLAATERIGVTCEAERCGPSGEKRAPERRVALGKSLVALASNTAPPQTESENLAGTASARANPMAFEALVTVTGARPSSEGARDLFTEETRTILVFVDGAVIQLASPVNEGQLLFLTNKKSNEEVVCQVLHKRTFGGSTCYVELEFTEEKPNYWGVTFSKERKRGAEFTAAEQVAAKQITEQDGASVAPVRSEKDVDEPKTQAEALRRQLVELEQKNAEQAAAKAIAERAAAETALKEADKAKASVAKVKLKLAPVNDPSPEKSAAAAASGTASGGEALLMPAASPEKKAPPGWTVPMSLPTQAGAGSAKEVATESLPKPELDFSRVPNAATAEEIAARGSLKVTSPWREKVRMVGLIVVLVAVGLGSYEKVAPYFASLAKKTASSGGAAKSAGPRATPAKPAAAATTGSAAGSNAAAAKSTGAEPSAAVAGKDSGAGNNAPAPSTEPKESAPAPKQPEAGAEMKAPVVKERAGTKKSRAGERAAEVTPAEAVPADAPVIPAKLLRAATPVYPPDAMRKYITGDVKAELVVGASGKVGEVKVVSGPNALRDAALDALKRYEYEPATQGGKAVASKTTAVVKFWFNP